MKKPLTPPVADASSTRPGQPARRLLPTGFVLLSICSVQLGAALAKGLFSTLGPIGTVGLRVSWAAVLLLILWRAHLRHAQGWKAYRSVVLFGIVLAAMNLTFYSALSRIPLGVAVALEFVGPLMLAIVQSRRLLDAVWVLCAACGILLLTPLRGLGGTSLDLLGLGLALLSGVFWVGYILLTARVGRLFPGGAGLALASGIAALLLLPLGIWQAGSVFFQPALLAIGVGVGLLSSALPYSLEMEALRHLPSRVFSILLSLEPGIAALVGFVVLHEQLTWQTMIAIALISVASIGVVSSQRE